MTKSAFENKLDSILCSQARPYLGLALIATIMLGLLGYYAVADNDLFARLAVGQLITQQGAVPTADVFAFSPTKNAWYDHEWLSGLVFYLLYSIGGDGALALYTAALMLFSFYLIFLSQRNQNLYLLAAAVFPCMYVWNNVVRSHVHTYLFVAYTLFAIQHCRKHNSFTALWPLPLVFVLWVNFHAGFVVGLGFFGLFVAALVLQRSSNATKAIVLLGLCMAAVLANPYGVTYVEFLVEAIAMDRPQITEWRSTSLFHPKSILLWVAMGGLLWSLYKNPKAIPLEGLGILLISLVFGLKHQRHLAFFFFALACYLPYLLSALPPISKYSAKVAFVLRSFTLALIACSALSVGYLCYFAPSFSQFELRKEQYPVGAINWMKDNNLEGKLLVHFNEGSYVLWRGYPDLLISIDGRYEEVYPKSTFDTAMQAYAKAPSIRLPAIAKLGPDYILVCKSSTPQLHDSDYPEQWSRLYQDNRCFLLETK